MSPIPQSPRRPNTRPILNPPFQWNQLTSHQQNQLAHLLARLLRPHLSVVPPQQQEGTHEQSSQNQ